MRWWSFKRGTLVLMILAAPMLAEAAGRDTVTVRTDTLPAKEQTPFMYRYDRRLERYQRRFNSLIPQTHVLQFYGDMGLVSVGIGWDYGKREQWETNFLIGVVPKYNSDKTRLSFTLKQNYTPWSFSLNEVVSLEPLSTGLYLNTIFGDKFWTHEPDRYPQGYYGFSTRVRIHIFAGQSVTFAIPREKRFFAKAVSAFYELSSCDLYIVSAFTNGYLKPKDYLRLSFGLRFKIL
ncbi:MAG: hypothetical protein PUD47_06845 [Bacteroidales bacterium]|nr:hypothetical protein [Bacteroidales bacterium]